MRCANPACQVEALYLRGGSIYCIDRELDGTGGIANRGQRQMIWLCPDCSQTCVVETWRQPGQQLQWLCRQPAHRQLMMHVKLDEKVAA